MSGAMIRIGVPAVGAAASVGAAAAFTAGGWLPDAVAFWLWPCLIAVLLLGATLLVLLRGARVWVVPPAVGALVQLVGLGLLVARILESRWEPLWYTLGAVGTTLVVMAVTWAVRTVRARRLERSLADGAGGADGQDLERIRDDMQQALALLRRAGRGRNAIYELPWFLVMGRPAAGKTVAIKNSGLGLPVKKDWVKGVGGTYTCDWFFTNEMIFLDTPGGWVTEGADETGQEHWKQLLRLLRKHRGRRPLDGLVVVAPADDLLGLDEAAIEEQAANARTVVDLMHAELGFRFPVYILVTKCDLVDGFVDFFRGLPAQRRHEILGFSNDDPHHDGAAALVRDGFRRVVRRLESYRLEMLGRVARRSHARRLLFFTEEFRGLERPLSRFTETFFRHDRYSEPPVFRGFYFSSGTQGEGEPMSHAIGRLAKTLGVRPVRAPEDQEEEPKRAYFLLDLFRELMARDEGLVGRTAGHWWRRRRNTLLGAFAPAGLAVTLVLLSLAAFLLNRGLYREVERDAPRIVEQLATTDVVGPDAGILAALDDTERLRGFHRSLAGFAPFRGFGMRRPGALAGETGDLFRDAFRAAVLEPTLRAAERLATSPDESCTARVDVLHSVVWLRMGRRAQFDDDLAGFDRVWGLAPADAADARRRLLLQYGTYLRGVRDDADARSLLPGFSLREVARHVRDSCGSSGSASTLAQYQHFQTSCGDAVTRDEVEACFAQLSEVLRHRQDDYERFVAHFRALLTDLRALETDEPEARRGLELLGTIDLADSRASECLARFEQTLAPVVERYAVRGEFLDECRQAVEPVADRGEKFRVRNEVLRSQEEALADDAEDLRLLMRDYSLQCRGEVDEFRRLDFDTLHRVATSYRRVSCLDLGGGEPGRRPAEPSRPRAAATVAAAPSPAPRFDWLAVGSSVPGRHRVSHWAARRAEWTARLENADAGFDDRQRRHLIDTLRGEIDAYATAYSRSWQRYLGGLDWTPRRGSVAEWLRRLSTTTELARALRPAVEAAAIAEPGAAPPFDAVDERLRSLQGLARFAAGGLAEYQSLLARVASDLETCGADPAFFATYRAGVDAGRADVALVRARDWVRREAGPGLVDGALRDLLARPLDDAEAFVRSDNLLRGQWADLQAVWQRHLDGRAPFAGLDAERVADLDALVAVFGGESGAVRRVRDVATGAALAPDAAAWLERAEALSRILFEPGTDRPRAARMRLTLGEPRLEPAGFDKANRVESLRLYLGEGADVVWTDDADRTRPVSVPLVGDDASRFGFVRATVARRKGLVGRVIGADWRDGESIDAVTAEGYWAALRVIDEGLRAAGGSPDDERLALEFDLEASFRKDTPGRVALPVTAEGRDLPTLLRLVRSGFPAPPAGAIGG